MTLPISAFFFFFLFILPFLPISLNHISSSTLGGSCFIDLDKWAMTNLGIVCVLWGDLFWCFPGGLWRGKGIILNWHHAGVLMVLWSLGDQPLTLLASISLQGHCHTVCFDCFAGQCQWLNNIFCGVTKVSGMTTAKHSRQTLKSPEQTQVLNYPNSSHPRSNMSSLFSWVQIINSVSHFSPVDLWQAKGCLGSFHRKHKGFRMTMAEHQLAKARGNKKLSFWKDVWIWK